MSKKGLLWTLLAETMGIAIAVFVLPAVFVDGDYVSQGKTIILAGLVLGLFNFFIKPLINLITLPLKIITLGLLGVIVNMAIIWGVDILFPSLHIKGFIALFLTALICWLVNLLTPKKKQRGLLNP